MYIVTATHTQTPREFGPFPTEQQARDWIIRHGEHLTNARVRHMQGASTMTCYVCGNTTGPCEHMSAHLYPEDDMDTQQMHVDIRDVTNNLITVTNTLHAVIKAVGIIPGPDGITDYGPDFLREIEAVDETLREMHLRMWKATT